MEQENHYDVAIVGASIAGCTAAAILYARQGLKVALIEKLADLGAFKKVCTHYVQGCATPTIRRLGLDSAIEACSGVRNSFHMWTPYGGRVRCYGDHLSQGIRVEKIVTAKNMHTICRSHRLAGFTLVGDALVAADPYAGVGIGWAFQGAESLVDLTSGPLIAGHERPLTHAVMRYEKLYHGTIGNHAKLIASYSSGRKFLPLERALFSAGARDPRIAHHIDAYLNRVINVRQALSPSIFLRAFWVNAKAYWRNRNSIGTKVAQKGPDGIGLPVESEGAIWADCSEPQGEKVMKFGSASLLFSRREFIFSERKCGPSGPGQIDKTEQV